MVLALQAFAGSVSYVEGKLPQQWRDGAGAERPSGGGSRAGGSGGGGVASSAPTARQVAHQVCSLHLAALKCLQSLWCFSTNLGNEERQRRRWQQPTRSIYDFLYYFLVLLLQHREGSRHAGGGAQRGVAGGKMTTYFLQIFPRLIISRVVLQHRDGSGPAVKVPSTALPAAMHIRELHVSTLLDATVKLIGSIDSAAPWKWRRR